MFDYKYVSNIIYNNMHSTIVGDVIMHNIDNIEMDTTKGIIISLEKLFRYVNIVLDSKYSNTILYVFIELYFTFEELKYEDEILLELLQIDLDLILDTDRQEVIDVFNKFIEMYFSNTVFSKLLHEIESLLVVDKGYIITQWINDTDMLIVFNRRIDFEIVS